MANAAADRSAPIEGEVPGPGAQDNHDAPRTSRRGFLSILAVPALFLAQPSPASSPVLGALDTVDAPHLRIATSFSSPRSAGWLTEMRAEWATFAQRYVTSEGRVVDTSNGDISHSEGQGTALLFAAEAGDLDSFERILKWTRSTLGHQRDFLHSWRYNPTAITPVSDSNNATDGDILIAWALQRAAERFDRPDFVRLAAKIASDIQDLCTRRVGQRLLLLPGLRGFEHRDHVVLNPSYYLFPALLDFERIVPGSEWRQLVKDGLEICCRSAAFGRWNLPADWIEVPRDATRPIRMAQDKPTRFSWDAVRVPLNLAWGRNSDEPMLNASASFWADPSHRGSVPAWVDLRTDSRAPYAGHAGVQAVALLATASCDRLRRAPNLPCVAQATDYFGAALTLMARMAWQDAQGMRG
jgi:endo-1,4-beta-D-glucanase Y